MMIEDGLENVKMIGLHDKSGDGIIGYEDFINIDELPELQVYDTDGVPGISNDELLAAIKNDPSIEEDIKSLIRPKIKE